MTTNDLNKGDTVTWTFGTGTLDRSQAHGVVLETDLDKFGYDDVILVDAGDHTTHIRPKDLI